MITYYETTMPVEPNLSPYRYHQIAWKGYLSMQGGDTPFQVHVDRSINTMKIRSAVKPQWPPYFQVEVEEIRDEGSGTVDFDIILDPCKRGDREIHLDDPGEVLRWALQKLERAGLDVEEARLRPVEDFPMIRTRSGSRVPTSPWEFRVHARIADPEGWEKAMIRGIGRKKRFGFGMPRPRGT